MLEDQVEDLQAKVDLLEVVQGENARLKAQMDSMNMVRVWSEWVWLCGLRHSHTVCVEMKD